LSTYLFFGINGNDLLLESFQKLGRHKRGIFDVFSCLLLCCFFFHILHGHQHNMILKLQNIVFLLQIPDLAIESAAFSICVGWLKRNIFNMVTFFSNLMIILNLYLLPHSFLLFLTFNYNKLIILFLKLIINTNIVIISKWL
jgi:hypothetical protein